MVASEHFSEKELACRCGCGLNNCTEELLELAEEVREVLGDKPMVVHSACRCEKHNTEVGGAHASSHLTGRAIDFHVQGMDTDTAWGLIMAAYLQNRLLRLGGLGRYSWGLHIDISKQQDGTLRTWMGK